MSLFSVPGTRYTLCHPRIYGLVEETDKKHTRIYTHTYIIRIRINNKNKNNDGKYSGRIYYFTVAALGEQKFHFWVYIQKLHFTSGEQSG